MLDRVRIGFVTHVCVAPDLFFSLVLAQAQVVAELLLVALALSTAPVDAFKQLRFGGPRDTGGPGGDAGSVDSVSSDLG